MIEPVRFEMRKLREWLILAGVHRAPARCRSTMCVVVHARYCGCASRAGCGMQDGVHHEVQEYGVIKVCAKKARKNTLEW